MKYFLSSFKLGDKPSDLLSLLDGRQKIGYIQNALDNVDVKGEPLKSHIQDDVDGLKKLGLNVIDLDLKKYFGKTEVLLGDLKNLSGLWVSGGNVFVLRQAMKLSGLDTLICDNMLPAGFTYGGYSAGCCVLSPNLKAYQTVDDPEAFPYRELRSTVWEGLGILDFAFMPHYQSNHMESVKIDAEIQCCIDKKVGYKAFSDGQVYII